MNGIGTVEEGKQALTELQGLNNPGRVAPIPKRVAKFAAENPVTICNVSPYSFRYEHPIVGILTIPACKPGEEYACVRIPGIIYSGLRLEMKGVEMRPDDGRMFALDVLGLGRGMKAQESLVQVGVFVAANNTFSFKNPEAWGEDGECADEPTVNELRAAQKRFLEYDQNLIDQGDRHWNEGPTQATAQHMGHQNISSQMREACTRRGQSRPWNQEIQQMVTCPGCEERIRPGIPVHICGAVIDWEKAIALGMRKESDRPVAETPQETKGKKPKTT